MQAGRFFFLEVAAAVAAINPLPGFSLRGVDKFDLFAGIFHPVPVILAILPSIIIPIIISIIIYRLFTNNPQTSTTINENRFYSAMIKEKETIDNNPNFPTSLNTNCAQIHVYATVCAR